MARSIRAVLCILVVFIVWSGAAGAMQPLVEVEVDAANGALPTVGSGVVFITVESALSHPCGMVAAQISPNDLEYTSHVHPLGSPSAEAIGSVLRFIQVNEYYITFPGTGESWQAPPMIAHMLLTKPVDTLLVKVQFKNSGVDLRILQSTAGRVAIRPSNSIVVTLVIELESRAPHAIVGSIDLNIALGKIQEFADGPHTVEVQLTSPHVKEVLTIPLGEIDLRKVRARHLSAIALPDLWDGTVWQKFIDHCELIPWYEPMLESRLWWSEVFITVFSIGYCSAAYWLGPLDFTPWQKRCYRVACVSSLLFQVAFGLSVAKSVSTRLVVPFALGFGVVYFISFNFTNVLILWEYSQTANEDSATDHAPGRFAVWRRRPDRGRTFHTIPSSNQLNGMTRVVMIGYKPARYC